MGKFTKAGVLLACLAVSFCVFSCESEEEKARKERARIEMKRARIVAEIKNADDSVRFYIKARNSAWDSLGAGINFIYPECDMSSLKHRLDSAKKGLLKDPFLPHCYEPLPPHLAAIRDSVNSYYNAYIIPYQSRFDSLKRILKEFPHDS
jgi:hypothetical protein